MAALASPATGIDDQWKGQGAVVCGVGIERDAWWEQHGGRRPAMAWPSVADRRSWSSDELGSEDDGFSCR